MSGRHATLLLILACFLCAAFIGQILAATINHVEKFQTSLAPNQVKVVLLEWSHFNPQVTVYANEKLNHILQGSSSKKTRINRQFIVLGPFTIATNVVLQADIAAKPKIRELGPVNSNEIAIYRQLSQASTLWLSLDDDNQRQAIELLQNLLVKQALPNHLKLETAHLLAAMWLAKEKPQQGLAVINSIQSVLLTNTHVSANKLTTTDFLILKAEATFQLRDFEQAILLRCQYLDKALFDDSSKVVTHVDADVKIQLSRSIIERQRNIKRQQNDSPDKQIHNFKDGYLNNCKRAIASFTNKNSPDYSDTKHRPMDDAKTILQWLLITESQSKLAQVKSQIFGQLWNYHTVEDEHIEAEKMARLAIANHNIEKGSAQLASFYWYLGTSLQRQGLLKQAQHIWRKGLVLANQQGGESITATSYFNLAYSYLNVGQYPLAERYFAKTLAADELSEGPLNWQKGPLCNKDGVYSAMTIVQLGVLSRIAGRLDEALIMQQCAQTVFDGTNEYYGLLAKIELAAVQLALDNIDATKVLVEEVLKDNRTMEPQQLDGLLLAIKVALLSQAKADIEPLANQMAKILGYENIHFAIKQTNQNYPKRQIELYELLIRHYAGEDDLTNVKQFGEKAIQLIESIKQQVLNTQAWSAAQHSVLSEYVEALHNSSISEYLPTIFSLLDRYYSINLSVDSSRYQSEVNQPILPDLLEKLWQAKLAAQRALVSSGPKQHASNRAQADSANEQYLAYQHETSSVQNIANKAPLNLTQLQQAMPERDILLRYFISEKLSFVFVVTKSAFAIKPIANQATIKRLVSEFNSKLFGADVLAQVTSSKLAEILPLDLINTHQYQRLIVVADDALHRVPFSLLNVSYSDKGQSKYSPLSTRAEIIRSYSAASFYGEKLLSGDDKAGGDKLKSSSGDIVLFADPEFQQSQVVAVGDTDSQGFKLWLSQQQRLPQTAVEAANIARLFSSSHPSKVHIAIGKAATNQFLLSPLARNASVLHIATHGYYHPKTPNIVGILTANETASQNSESSQSNGFLGLDELLSESFSADLVVISGCETMAGQYYQGSGNRSMTRGLLARGVKSVIGTLWKVADRPTALFMTAFYKHLHANQGDTSKALKLAKQQFAQRGRYRHPKYWAGFVLTATYQSFQLSF